MTELRNPFKREKQTTYDATYILLPANPAWIYFTIIVSWILNISPPANTVWAPDFLMLSLLFWNVREPRTISMFVPFIFGLLMDVYDASVFGQHALAYTVLSYVAVSLQRRLPWFSLAGQTLHVLPIFLSMQALVMLVRLWLGGSFPGWDWFAQSFVSTALWPIWSVILTIPQRRSVYKDDTRPI